MMIFRIEAKHRASIVTSLDLLLEHLGATSDP